MAAALPATMKAWQYSSFTDGAEALKLAADVPVPAVTKGHLLVKVAAASLNSIDWKLQEGFMRPVLPFHIPFTPGVDAAGEVVAVGPDVDLSAFAVGDKVFGGLDISVAGAFAEYVLLPAAMAARLPPAVSPTQSLSLVTAGCAALQALRDSAGVPIPASGESPSSPLNILVANASGGVGICGVQLAKLAGAHVTATCGQRNIDFVKSLGADEVLDYRSPEGKALKSPSGKKYDVILDGTLHMTWAEAEPVLGPTGKWLHLSPGPAILPLLVWQLLTLSKKRLVPVLSAAKTADLASLASLLGEGKLKVVTDSEFPFSQLPEAWSKSKKGPLLGKVVVLLD